MKEDANKVASSLLRAAAACEGLRPSNLLEITAFAVGTKSALRFVLSSEDADVVSHAAHEAQIRHSRRSIGLQRSQNGWAQIVPSATSERAQLLVLSSQLDPEEILTAETSNAAQAGLFLGYPECCVRALPQIDARGPQWPFVFISATGPSEIVDARLNRFAAEWGGIGLLGELFPCSLSCENAKHYADQLHASAVALGLVRLADTAVEHALMPVSIANDGTVAHGDKGGGRLVTFRW